MVQVVASFSRQGLLREPSAQQPLLQHPHPHQPWLLLACALHQQVLLHSRPLQPSTPAALLLLPLLGLHLRDQQMLLEVQLQEGAMTLRGVLGLILARRPPATGLGGTGCCRRSFCSGMMMRGLSCCRMSHLTGQMTTVMT